jgi:hypothetical protein
MYAFGYPLLMPEEVKQRCSSVVLEFAKGDELISLERGVDQPFPIRVRSSSSSRSKLLKDDREASSWFLEAVGLPSRTLSTKSGGPAIPYLGLIGPAVWVDQDLGWRSTYATLPTQRFIEHQEEEILRLLLDVPPRKVFRSKEESAAAKNELAALDERLASARKALESLASDTGGGADIGDLARRRSELVMALERSQSGMDAIRSVAEPFSPLIAASEQESTELRRQLRTLEFQRARVDAAVSEIGAESDLLETNEVAADAFRRFCPAGASCQLFRGSAQSYGRRLLYVRDQIKDMSAASGALVGEVDRVRRRLDDADARASGLRSERDRALQGSTAQAAAASIQKVATELAAVDLAIARAAQLAEERKRLEALLERRERARERVEELKSRAPRTTEPPGAEARATLQVTLGKWLERLNTQNIDRPVLVDEQFRLFLGKERFAEGSAHSGSTRTRIVLAFHAALMETALTLGGNHPGFLILDAPRQHELAEPDFVAYIRGVRELAAAFPDRSVQVVTAVADLHVDPTGDERVWKPNFGDATAPRFFGESG